MTRTVSKIAARLGLDRLVPNDDAAVFDEAAMAKVDLTNRVGFAVGTGRCGTLFVAQLLEHEPVVAAYHERDSLLETFHRYCKWHQLPVDDEGFLHAMETGIRRDLVTHQFSFESSCHLSLSIDELEQRFAPRIALFVRHPRKVVKSHITKGWYDGPVVQRRSELALGYQAGRQFHHFLGRITPRGPELESWNELTRVGKLAWFWATLNQAVIDQATKLPVDRYRLYRLEDFGYDAYCEFARFVGFTPQVTPKKFDDVRGVRDKKRKQDVDWTEAEWAEFERYTAPLATKLDYDLRA